jgi:hypothetical protein
MDALKSELYLSQKPSIDAFLEHRPEFLNAGKIGIALSLLSKENPDAFNGFEIRDQGIYHFLYNSLTASWEEFKENKLTVVTFNYDRSFEYFLFSALKHSYNKSDKEIFEAIRNTIIHVHGSLGPFPWQASGGSDYYPLFRQGKGIPTQERVKRIEAASKNIVIVSEAQPNSMEFERATNYIREAERVYFLGFGYYRVNLERLGLSQLEFIDGSVLDSFFDTNYSRYMELKTGTLNSWRVKGVAGQIDEVEGNFPAYYKIKQFRGSAFRLGHAQMKSIQDEWRIGLPDNQCDALQFLKEYADLT